MFLVKRSQLDHYHFSRCSKSWCHPHWCPISAIIGQWQKPQTQNGNERGCNQQQFWHNQVIGLRSDIYCNKTSHDGNHNYQKYFDSVCWSCCHRKPCSSRVLLRRSETVIINGRQPWATYTLLGEYDFLTSMGSLKDLPRFHSPKGSREWINDLGQELHPEAVFSHLESAPTNRPIK